MIPVYTPRSESEASVIAALLSAYGVDFVMQGGAFSTMYPGSLSTSLNTQIVLVREDQEALARQLIEDFTQSAPDSDDV